MALKYVNIYLDRHGKERAYYRRGRKRVSLPLPVGGAEFLAAYNRLKECDDAKAVAAAEEPRSLRRGTFAHAASIYYSSSAFRSLRESTKRTYRSTIDGFCERYGNRSVAGLKYEHIEAIIGGMEDRPAAANKLLKRLRTLFKVAKRAGWISSDPSEGIKFYKIGEIHTWTADQHKAFLDQWGPGTKPRLAYMLHFHTGQRRSDIVSMVRPKSAGGSIRVEQVKTGTKLELSVPAPLWEEMERHPKRHMVILTTEYGKPFSVAGYGNWFRERCREAGLPDECSSHGLRKAAATELADAGCTAHEIAAVTGHKSLREVEGYTRAADQKRLARSASEKRSRNQGLTNPKSESDKPTKQSVR